MDELTKPQEEATRIIEAIGTTCVKTLPIKKSICLLGYSFEGCTYINPVHEACNYCDKFKNIKKK